MIEWAETALLERLGLLDDVYGHLPRVHISIDFKELLDHRDLIDVNLAVVEVGKTSITYDFWIQREHRECVRARIVTALRSPDGAGRAWPEEHRRLLVTAGPQPPELLIVSKRTAEQSSRRIPT
jgi:acyl-CoA thioester hydrolase